MMNMEYVKLGIAVFAVVLLIAIFFSGFLFGGATTTHILDITVAQMYGVVLFAGLVYTFFVKKR